MEESKTVYECNKCYKTFDRQERVEKHNIKGCDGIQCNICSKKLHSHLHLNKHKTKRRSCDVCSTEFCSVAAYIQHIRTEHTTVQRPQTLLCGRCNQRFSQQQRLDAHVAKQVCVSCDECNRPFCSESRLQQHRLTEHYASGDGIGSSSEPLINLDTPILGNTGYQNTDGYKTILKKHYSNIKSHTIQRGFWKKINKQISDDFSYGDLKQLLEEAKRQETEAFRVNIGFGTILYDTVGGVYRYFYVSTNHYLFDRAYTISTNSDMQSFFDKIVSLDILQTYYFTRPSSGWILAGLPNVEVKIMRIIGVPIG